MSDPISIAVVQARTGTDPKVNADFIRVSLESAAEHGAKIAFTPEMSGLLEANRAHVLARATVEEFDPTLAAAREVAARTGIWVQLGSLAIRAEPLADRLVNRAFLIDGGGAIVARYDKVHLFDVDLGEGQRYRESATYSPGDRAVVAGTPWGPLALSICYDVRFPELYRALAVAEPVMIAVPAAFTRPTGEAHWHTLLRARAIETGAFVIAAAQSGHHEDGRETFGHSLVVDPWGQVVMDMGTELGVRCTAIDLGAVTSARSRLPTLGHRRAYDLVTPGMER